MPLWIKETYINKTEGYRFGDFDVIESFTDDPGRLFKELQREYGRCTGRVHVDKGPDVLDIGWVFEKRMKYEDATGNKPTDYYLREVWVTVHDKPPTKTVEYHYHID